jgi:site-specific recombinase XerD
MTTNPNASNNHFKAFASYLKIEEGKSDKTITAYLNDITRFRSYLDNNPVNGLPLSWQEVTAVDLRTYLTSLDPSPNYFHRVHSSLKKWFHYLKDVIHIREDNPLDTLKKPKKSSHHPPALSMPQVRDLIQTALEDSRPNERIRNWTLIAFMVNTGLRVAEVANMNESDLSFKDGLPHRIDIVGKGNKQRRVILSANAKTALQQWMRHRRSLLIDLPPNPSQDREAIWIVPAGRYKGNRITPAAIRKIMRTFGNKANIQTNVHPHLLRHTYGTELARRKVSLHTIKELLGHASLATTGIYLHADDAELEAAASVMPDILNNPSKQQQEDELEVMREVVRGMG